MKKSDAIDPCDLKFYAQYRFGPHWGYCAIVRHIPTGKELILECGCSHDWAIRKAREAEWLAKTRQHFFRNVHLW